MTGRQLLFFTLSILSFLASESALARRFQIFRGGGTVVRSSGGCQPGMPCFGRSSVSSGGFVSSPGFVSNCANGACGGVVSSGGFVSSPGFVSNCANGACGGVVSSGGFVSSPGFVSNCANGSCGGGIPSGNFVSSSGFQQQPNFSTGGVAQNFQPQMAAIGGGFPTMGGMNTVGANSNPNNLPEIWVAHNCGHPGCVAMKNALGNQPGDYEVTLPGGRRAMVKYVTNYNTPIGFNRSDKAYPNASDDGLFNWIRNIQAGQTLTLQNVGRAGAQSSAIAGLNSPFNYGQPTKPGQPAVSGQTGNQQWYPIQHPNNQRVSRVNDVVVPAGATRYAMVNGKPIFDTNQGSIVNHEGQVISGNGDPFAVPADASAFAAAPTQTNPNDNIVYAPPAMSSGGGTHSSSSDSESATAAGSGGEGQGVDSGVVKLRDNTGQSRPEVSSAAKSDNSTTKPDKENPPKIDDVAAVKAALESFLKNNFWELKEGRYENCAGTCPSGGKGFKAFVDKSAVENNPAGVLEALTKFSALIQQNRMLAKDVNVMEAYTRSDLDQFYRGDVNLSGSLNWDLQTLSKK